MSIFEHKSEAFKAMGNLAENIIKKTASTSSNYGNRNNSPVDRNLGQFRVIYTKETTILVSEGISDFIFRDETTDIESDSGVEFYIELKGKVPVEKLEKHFLVAFLDNTIDEALSLNIRDLIAKTSSFGGWPLTLRYCNSLLLESGETALLKEYLLDETHDNQIGALLGIKSENVPAYMTVDGKKINLVGVTPYSNLWLNDLYFPEEEEENLRETIPRLKYQHKLVYGNLLTPLDGYSDYGESLKTSGNPCNDLRNLYRNDSWSEIIYRTDDMLADSLIFYEMYFFRAKAFYNLKKYKESVAAYKETIEKYPDEIKPYIEICHPLHGLGLKAEGIPYYSIAVEKARGSDKILALAFRGSSYFSLKDYQNAINDSLACYESDYTVTGITVNLPEYYLLNNQPMEAASFIDRVIEKEKKDYKIILYFLKMIALMLAEKDDEAEEAYAAFKKLAGKRKKELGFTLKNLLPELNKDDAFINLIKERAGSLFSL